MLEMYRRDQFREDLLADRCNELLGLDARLHELDEMLAASRRRDPGRPLRVRRAAAVGAPTSARTAAARPDSRSSPAPSAAIRCRATRASARAAAPQPTASTEGEAASRPLRRSPSGDPQPSPRRGQDDGAA